MKFKPLRVNHDFYIKKIDDYYEILAYYIDNILSFGKKSLEIVNELKKAYILKGIREPEYFLREKII